MRLTNLFHLAETYLKLGMIATGFILGTACIGYFLIYKKLLHGEAKFPLKKLAAAAVILCYLIVVLGATLLGRGGLWSEKQISFLPFLSYREAWNSFSAREWRNIILNICMFVPLGLLLPFYSRRWQRASLTYLTGLAFTLVIELVQLVFHRGIFELDDIFNNLLGTMIGYGFYRLFRLVHPKAQPEPVRPAVLYQLPLLFTAVMFGTIFTVYRLQEFGNLQQQYISRADLSATDLELHAKLSSEPQTVPVYRMSVADESQTRAVAQDLFEKLGTQIDDSETDLYDETAIYWNQGRNYSIWIDYAGCPVDFTDFSVYTDLEEEHITEKSGCSKDEILKALEPYQIQIPEHAEFYDRGNGRYEFEADLPSGDSLCQGTFSCTYYSNGKIYSFHNAIITYQKYRDCAIISEQEAYERLTQGKFRADYFPDGLSSIVTESAELEYTADSKGFYQPVYTFLGDVNGKAAQIQIPALS